MHKAIIVFLLFFNLLCSAQEFNCQIQINAEQTGRVDLQIFKTLKRSLSEFVNNNQWTDQEYRNDERINCSFFINVIEYDNNRFKTNMQVLASRPVFGSSYETVILNINDKEVNFDYLEFAPLQYNPNSFDSNLVSVIAFYLYTILGVDADTFSPKGGTDFYQEAKAIVNFSQSSNESGWKPNTSKLNRNKLNNDLLSGTFDGYREAMYEYHRQGLDIMHEDPKKGKETIITSFESLKSMNDTRSNSTMMRVFFDAKAEEISKIFSDGPSVDVSKTISLLNRIGPTYSKNWKEIKF